MAKVKKEFRWLKSKDAIVDRTVLRGGATAMFMAETWHRLYMPFIPRIAGTLSTGAVTKSVTNGGRTGLITHSIIYATRQYLGSWHRFSTHVHPQATSHWDRAAKSAGRASQLVRDVQNFLK